MGSTLHTIHIDEYRAAALHEQEFVEIARTLKALAADLGVASAPAIDALVCHGLDAAIDCLSDLSNSNASSAFHRHRACWRAKQGGVPTVH